MFRHIIILGAGVSGLATAWFLKQWGGDRLKLTIIDQSACVGGLVQTWQVDDFLFEQGPRSCRSAGGGRETLALIEALGLQDQVIVPSDQARSRYVYYQGHLQCLPKHFWEFPFNPLCQGWIKAIWRDWFRPSRSQEDESVQEFFTRRLGKEWVERLIDPLVRGIYAGDCSRLSMKSCFPLFDQWEQQKGSLLRGAWSHTAPPPPSSPFQQAMRRIPLFSFKEGMASLPRALGKALEAHLLLKRSVSHLSFSSKGVEVTLDDGEKMQADLLVSTLPSFSLAKLLTGSSLLMSQLTSLSYASVWVVNLGFRQAVLPLQGFGYLTPSTSGSPVLGCVWDSSIFPEQNLSREQSRLTVMVGGSDYPTIANLSEQAVLEEALKALREHCGIRCDPQVVQMKCAQQAIPQYQVGHENWREEIQELLQAECPHLTLSGTMMSGVGVNDCIVHAKQVAAQLALSIALND